MKAVVSIVFTIMTSMMIACGPTDDPDLEPEEVFTAFCANLFACPDANDAMGVYGSQEECVDVHHMDHERRDTTCRPRVLLLEDCLATLTCHELEDYIQATGSACDDERLHLVEECAPL